MLTLHNQNGLAPYRLLSPNAFFAGAGAGNSAPVIEAQTKYALDGATAGQANIQVIATDDGAITYAITAGNTNDDWIIDEDTGLLTNQNTLDINTTAQYNLTVEVDDLVNPAESNTVTINVTLGNVQTIGNTRRMRRF